MIDWLYFRWITVKLRYYRARLSFVIFLGDPLCTLGGHQLCEYAENTGWWWCRCKARSESSSSRLFGDQVAKW